MDMTVHGGDIYRNKVKLDFSVNINPLGVPEAVRFALHEAAENCSTYPDMEAEALKQAVSAMLSVPEEFLLFGNGSSELFLAVVHAVRPGKTVIPVPSFYGYEHAAGAVQGAIFYYETKPEQGFCITEEICTVLTEEVDLLFLASPNNPTGHLMSREVLRTILCHCRERGIYVVLDECFIEFCGAASSLLSDIGQFDNLILVRAFTKIFAIPGVRLGYLICSNRMLLQRIKRQLPEWNLSCFAQAAGMACAGETAFIKKTVDYIQRERQFLEEGLQKKGFRVFPSGADFILFYCEEPLYGRLLEKGILIRDCSNFRGLGKGFYRAAVKTRKENEILLKAMERECEED